MIKFAWYEPAWLSKFVKLVNWEKNGPMSGRYRKSASGERHPYLLFTIYYLLITNYIVKENRHPL